MYMSDIVCQHKWKFRPRDVPDKCSICAKCHLAHTVLCLHTAHWIYCLYTITWPHVFEMVATPHWIMLHLVYCLNLYCETWPACINALSTSAGSRTQGTIYWQMKNNSTAQSHHLNHLWRPNILFCIATWFDPGSKWAWGWATSLL